jgi:hypothetical protein
MQPGADWLDRAIAFVSTAMAVGFALVVTWALLESFSPVHLQPHGLRMVLAAAVLLAAIAMGCRSARRTAPRRPPPKAGEGPSRRNRNVASLRPGGSVEPDQASPGATSPDPVIASARARPIVFRELYPPSASPGLSFSGGLPIGPAELDWPRRSESESSEPLHFVMQWDCAELAEVDPTGLLPREGILYLFCDLEWGDPLAFRFVHAAGDPRDWRALPMPADLGPVFGSQGAWSSPYVSPRVPAEEQDAPRLLPRWPFKPVSLPYPAPESGSEDEERPGLFWSETSTKEPLLEAQNALGAPQLSFEPGRRHPPFARPFPGFPHDWAAVRIVCVKAIETLSSPHRINASTFLREADSETRQNIARGWLEEAESLYRRATGHSVAARVPQEEAEGIWAWIEAVGDVFRLNFEGLVKQSVNTSLGLGSNGIAAIPPEWIASVSLSHVLAHTFERDEYLHEFIRDRGKDLSPAEAEERWKAEGADGTLPRVREIFAGNPNRIFGPPSYVQGDVEERVDDWLLMLELHSKEWIGMPMGEGVIQFLVRPDDLRHGRFERVEAILTAY